MTDTSWTGATSNDYSNASNWDNSKPNGNNGIFGPNGANKSISDGNSMETPAGWIFNGSGYTIAVSGNAVVTFSGVGVQVNNAIPTINVLSNSSIDFTANSDGGAAAYSLDASSTIDFSVTTGPLGNHVVHAGSIDGSGNVKLGSNNLAIGGNNRSMVFSGTVSGGLGSGLTKVGTGTLTLTGNFISNGAVTLDSGTFDLASGTSVSQLDFGAGAQEIFRVESAALPGKDCATLVNNFAFGDSIDAPSFAFVPGHTTATYGTFHSLTVSNGVTTPSLVFDDVETSGPGNRFFVLGDHTGGSRIVLAIIESRAHKLVDAKHHPSGQPSPSGVPEVIVTEGANDTAKGVGGHETMVGVAHGGDVFFGGGKGDNFVFQTRRASPPGNPDTVMKFSHAKHDKIDLYDLRDLVSGHHPLVFIHGETFAAYNAAHHHTVGMVRFAGGELQVNFDHHLTTEFAIVVNGAVRASDLIL